MIYWVVKNLSRDAYYRSLFDAWDGDLADARRFDSQEEAWRIAAGLPSCVPVAVVEKDHRALTEGD